MNTPDLSALLASIADDEARADEIVRDLRRQVAAGGIGGMGGMGGRKRGLNSPPTGRRGLDKSCIPCIHFRKGIKGCREGDKCEYLHEPLLKRRSSRR